MKKGFLAVLFLLTTLLVVSMSVVVFAKEFTDIDATHWAFTYVDDLSSKGVINGYEDGTFRPNGNVTRAEFIKLMVCTNEQTQKEVEMFNKITGENGKDQPIHFDNWYDKYVYYCLAKGLIPYVYSGDMYTEPIPRAEMAGILECFAKFDGLYEEPDSSVNQEEMKALILQKAYETKVIKNKAKVEDFDEVWNSISEEKRDLVLEEVSKVYVVEESKEYDNAFSDIAHLNVLDKKSISVVKGLGIIKGYEDGTFKPENDMTRAEVSVVIYNYLQLLKGGK